MAGSAAPSDGSFFFPQTVVREFQIVHAGATAEVGGTNAGFVNIATKEGSNKYRGEAFYIGRPSALTSSDTFGHSLDNAQNEFGGSHRRAHQEAITPSSTSAWSRITSTFLTGRSSRRKRPA